MPSVEFFQMLSVSATWRSKFLPPRFWQRVWRTVPWMRRRFGVISKRFDHDRGADTLTSSRPDFLVSLSRSLANKPGHSIPDTSGRTSAGLSTGRGRVSSFLRTYQAYSLFDSLMDAPPMRSSDPSYNDWLTEFRQSSLQRRRLALHTNGNGYLSSGWTTPQTHDSQGGDPARVRRFGTQHGGANLADDVSEWQTPAADSFRSRGGDRKDEQGLDQQARLLWPTATSQGHGNAQTRDQATPGQTGGTTLAGEAIGNWTTPRSSDAKTGSAYTENMTGRSLSMDVNWPTPNATPDAPNNSTNRGKDWGGRRPRATSQCLGERAEQLWPTARAEDSESAGNHPDKMDSLTGVTRLWATPRTISGGGESAERKQELGRTISGGGDLQSQVEDPIRGWRTPSSRDWKDTEGMSTTGVNPDGSVRSRIDQLGRQVLLTKEPGPTSLNAGQNSPQPSMPKRRLNYRFVLWLMGFPQNWLKL